MEPRHRLFVIVGLVLAVTVTVAIVVGLATRGSAGDGKERLKMML